MDHSLVRKVTNVIRDLPTLPSVVNRINALLNDPKTQVADLAQVISADQSLSVKVLQHINSAYFGVYKTNDLQRAIVRLGFRSVSQIVTNVSICSMFRDDNEGFFDRSEFWRHSIAVAVLSRMIASRARHPRPDEAFTCGLLHDVGKLILDQYLHPEMTKVLRCAHQNKITFIEAEQRTTMPIDHTTIGELAAKTWRLPIVAVVSIRHHHTPLEERKGLPLSDDIMVDIVRYADHLAHEIGIGESGNGAPPEWSPDLVARLAVDAESIAAIREVCLAEIGETAAFLDLPVRQRAADPA